MKTSKSNTGVVVSIRRRGKRKPLPDHLPREEVIIDLPETEKICAKDGSALKEIGAEVSEQLDVIPMQTKIPCRLPELCRACSNTSKILPVISSAGQGHFPWVEKKTAHEFMVVLRRELG